MFEKLLARAKDLGATDAKLIDIDQLVFDPRAGLKCRFGCNRWGKYWTCPPNLHLSKEEFMESLKHYHKAIIFTATDPKYSQKVGLALEKEAMLALGSHFAFAMILCVKCDECSYPEPCRFPHLARPSMDAYSIDIGKTVEPIGLKCDFDKEGKMIPVWYGMVLLD